jgi:hypothetical protein
MKTNYKKIIMAGVILYGLNFGIQETRYLTSKNELNKTKTELTNTKDKYNALPYFAKRGYGHTMDKKFETPYWGPKRDNLVRTMNRLEKTTNNLEKKVENIKRKRITLF